LDPYPGVPFWCSHPFLPRRQRPRILGNALGTPKYPCNAASTGNRFRGCSHSLMFRLPCSLGLPAAPTAESKILGGQAPYTTQNSVRCLPEQWHHYVSDPGNWHGWTFTSWIAALSAAPPESGSDLGLSSGGLPDRGEAKVLAHIPPCHHRFTYRARPCFGGRLPLALCPGTTPGPPSAQSPFARLGCYLRRDGLPGPPRRALPLLLRSYGLMRQTKSLPSPTVTASVDGSSQVAASPCWEMAAG